MCVLNVVTFETPATTPAPKDATVDNGVKTTIAGAPKRTRKPAASNRHMFHLRRVNFHQYVRKVTNGTGGAVSNAAATSAATTATGEEHWEIEDGLEPIKDKRSKVRATMVLLDRSTKIGRNPELVDVVLHSVHHSNMISRDHSEIIGEVDKNGKFLRYYIRDNSLNGTYVNETRVDGKHLLKEGDVIKFGHVNGAAIKPGQFAPQVESEFVFKFERALSDYHYCGFTEQRARLYPDVKRAYLQVYSDRAEPELIPFEKGTTTLCGSAQPSTTAIPPASAIQPLPPTTSTALPKNLSKHAAPTIGAARPAAQAIPSTSATAPTIAANASNVTTSRPVVTNTATTAAVNPYAAAAANHQPPQPPALSQLPSGAPGHMTVDDVAAAAWMQLQRLQQQQQQQQQLQRYGGAFPQNALAAAAATYLSQNPASYAAALWPWAGRAGLQPNVATDWNQLSQQAAAAAYPGGAAAVAALQQHLQQVPQFANPYHLTASNTPSSISSSITGASSHSFPLPTAAAAMASAFSSLASTCYGSTVASTSASNGVGSATSYNNNSSSGAAVYSTSTTPASAAKLPNLFGAAGTSSSAVGNLPASLAAVLPALAGRSNALAQSATPAASAFTVPAAQTPLTALAAASSALSGNAAQVAQVAKQQQPTPSHAIPNTSIVPPDWGKITPDGKAPQDPHPNPPSTSAAGGIRPVTSSASSVSSLSSATSDKPLSAILDTSLSIMTPDVKDTSLKPEGKSEIISPIPRRIHFEDTTADNNLSSSRSEAKPDATPARPIIHCTSSVSDALEPDSALPINGVLDCKPSSSALSRSSDGGAVTKNDEDAPVPSSPKPAKREDGARSPVVSNPSRPCSLQSIPQSPPRAPRPPVMESRSPTASRSPAPIERPQSSHDEKKATDESKARTDCEESKKRADDDDDAASEKSKTERAKPIKHARKSNEVARLLNDLTAGNCSWMYQASRSQQRQDKSAKKKAPRLSMEERKLKDIQKKKSHKMMRQISDESSDDEERSVDGNAEERKDEALSSAGSGSEGDSDGPVGSHSSRSTKVKLTTSSRRKSDASSRRSSKSTLPPKDSTSGAGANSKSGSLQKNRANRERSSGNAVAASPPGSPLSPFTAAPRPFSGSPSAPATPDDSKKAKLSTQARRRLMRETEAEDQRKKLLERRKKEERRKAGKKTPGRKRRNPTPPNSSVKRRGRDSDDGSDSEDEVAAPPPKRASTVTVAKTSTATAAQRRSNASDKKKSEKAQKKVKRAKAGASSESDEETAPNKSAKKAKAAKASDDDEEEEADSDTYDKCAYKNCRRPQYENINWVQCDDCDEWYHNLCILGAEKAVEEDEFHCGCAKNGKRKAAQAQQPKKRQTV